MSALSKIKFWDDSDPFDQLVEGLAAAKGDADALALLPYDDGTFFLKQANFDKDLIGGQGGYETPDGDKIVMDGDGQPVKELFGVPMLLAVDPTEHAAAVDPIKALVAQKNNIGEWLRVDSKGNVIEVGDAVESAAGGEVTPLAESEVGEYAKENQVSMDVAMHQLADEGRLTKIFDIAPPATVATDGDGMATMTDGGHVELEEATHIAVDQSKATDLIPKTTSTTELNTALDKARMEEHDEDKWKNIFIQGMIAGSVIAGFFGLVFVGMFALLG